MASGFSVTLAITGSWLTYCSVRNVAPIKTLAAIIKTPANARQIISNRYYPLDGAPGVNPSGAPSMITSSTAGAKSANPISLVEQVIPDGIAAV